MKTISGILHMFFETGTEGSLWALQDENFMGEFWDYDGLHILKPGQHLTIFNKDKSSILWDGNIDFINYPVFTENVFGRWIHNDQRNISRETWAKFFIDGHYAILKIP